jgi:hypothetical protein
MQNSSTCQIVANIDMTDMTYAIPKFSYVILQQSRKKNILNKILNENETQLYVLHCCGGNE